MYKRQGLFGILHAAVGPVAVVCHIGIRFRAGHGFDGEREATRKFVYMSQGDGAPCVTLTGLDDNIRFGQCRGKPKSFTSIIIMVNNG